MLIDGFSGDACLCTVTDINGTQTYNSMGSKKELNEDEIISFINNYINRSNIKSASLFEGHINGNHYFPERTGVTFVKEPTFNRKFIMVKGEKNMFVVSNYELYDVSLAKSIFLSSRDVKTVKIYDGADLIQSMERD